VDRAFTKAAANQKIH